LIRAIIFDLDNTLTDFMKMKADAVSAAIDGMIDAGLKRPRAEIETRIDAIYQAHRPYNVGGKAEQVPAFNVTFAVN